MTRVERIERLLQRRHIQGEFSPAGQGRGFAELFITPLYSTPFDRSRARTAFFGAGIDAGYRYDWLFGSLSIGAFQSDTRRITATVNESLERVQLDLQIGAELQLIRGLDVCFGPGLSCVFDTIETTSVSSSGALQADQSNRSRARPEVAVGLADGSFFVRDVFTISNPVEARLDMGIVFGSRNF